MMAVLSIGALDLAILLASMAGRVGLGLWLGLPGCQAFRH